jgi:hypothetical protein
LGGQSAVLAWLNCEVQGDGLGYLDAAGRAGGDLVLVGAGGAIADAGIAAVAATVGGE